jgi:hypothetical protein
MPPLSGNSDDASAALKRERPANDTVGSQHIQRPEVACCRGLGKTETTPRSMVRHTNRSDRTGIAARDREPDRLSYIADPTTCKRPFSHAKSGP